MIHTLAISGYRSIRDLVLPLDGLTVVTGRNGAGKSSFYRSLRLLADVAQGRVVSSLASEGGLKSTLWAGPERVSRAMKRGEQPVQGLVRKNSVALRLGFAAQDYGYAIDLGFPVRSGSMFALDPEVKAEAVWMGDALNRRNVLAARAGPKVTGRDRDGRTSLVVADLAPYESMMTHAADPKELPELIVLRERMRGWRFYDHFRTDHDAPARSARVGTRTPVLGADGGDLAAALQTIREVGDGEKLEAAIADAFPGASIDIVENGERLELLMGQQGLLRSLRAAELSDGTLRYLLLLAALLTPRPPGLMVLNEPETSLHPDLVGPLARLVVDAAQRCQVVVVTHAPSLVDALAQAGALRHELAKELGETRIEGLERLAWEWPAR